MAAFDPNEEWLGHVQPVGLVIAPVVLKAYELVPEQQTRSDTEAIKPHLSLKDLGPAILDPWAFFADILGWRPSRVAGSPGGAPIPDDLILRIEESDIEIAPHWAVADPEGGWQMLVRVEAAGVDPDGRGALEGWEATPHQRLERLCKDRQVRTGVLVTDGELRLIHAPRGETSGWLRFPLRSLGEVGGRPMLGGLKLLLSSFRLHNDAPERRLSALLQKSRDEQAEVSTKLAAQVLGALHELMRGLHDADSERMERLARERPEHVYDGLLTVLLRLVFLLYAEDRELIPSRTDPEARRLYDQGYGVRTLHARLVEDRARHELTMHLRRGAWSRLLTLFRLVHQGDRSGDWIRGRGGKLFDPSAFPFLQGQDDSKDPPKPAEVSDECVAKVLDGLLVLGGEKLSYRTLDVEQIGSVYETVMGFTVEALAGPALAIRAGKNDRTPVFVDLNKLLAETPNDRAKLLKEEADRGKVTEKVGRALREAATIDELVAALTPIIDERASPGAAVAAPGTPLLQPTDERRRTGSHYTPRSLTEPIVHHALEPAFERIGPDATPEDVLQIKVCDPAMGSGAFLVEACRALGDRLVLAWARWPRNRPTIPPDEDEPLHARRLVAQRCLYGVDRNPRAVDLAKLSLWLATLARDHEFTFLDHALKCGDSLVGLDDSQIAAMHWDPSSRGLPLFRNLVTDRVTELASKRAEIQASPDDTSRIILETKHRDAEEVVRDVRVLGDAVLSAFFAGDKPRAREALRTEVQSWAEAFGGAKWGEISAAAMSLATGKHAVKPFHWQVEFPEVFHRKNPGFDAIFGNPPFLGGSFITRSYGAPYFSFLGQCYPGCAHHCDYVGYFMRRCYDLLRRGAVMGVVATKTVSQGDTREGVLQKILESDGQIVRARRSFRWPGEASVFVVVLHISKGNKRRSANLDGTEVARISAFLVPGVRDTSPERLMANPYISQGSQIYGKGFLFDDTDDGASPISEMVRIVQQNPGLKNRILPFIGGDEVTSRCDHASHRYAIFLSDIKEEGDLKEFPELATIVRKKVYPERMKLRETSSAKQLKKKWWAYQAHRPKLYDKAYERERVLAVSLVSSHLSFAFISSKSIFSHKLGVVPSDNAAMLAYVQSRPHEVWTRFLSSPLGDGVSYSPTDCFSTFPFPVNFDSNFEVREAGEAYHAHRTRMMLGRNEGLTETYNRFHSRGDNAADVAALRALHHEMDFAVLRAYGWDDLADRAAPEFIEQESAEGKTPKTRLEWAADLKDEVLARLLALNAERAAEELTSGILTADEERHEVEEGGSDE